MPVSNEDETGMAIRYVSINTEHHVILHIVHIMVPIEPEKRNIDKRMTKFFHLPMIGFGSNFSM